MDSAQALLASGGKGLAEKQRRPLAPSQRAAASKEALSAVEKELRAATNQLAANESDATKRWERLEEETARADQAQARRRDVRSEDLGVWQHDKYNFRVGWDVRHF